LGIALTCPNGCDAGWFYEVEAQIRRTVSIHEDGSVFVAPGPPYEVEEIGEHWPVFVCKKFEDTVPAMPGTFDWD
jgi:hypothetical protein